MAMENIQNMKILKTVLSVLFVIFLLSSITNASEISKDYRLTKKSAEQGDASAQYDLGYMFYYGQGVEKNYKEAFKWYKKSAEQGDASAQYSLGFMHFWGQGVEKNHKEAFKWYKKSAEQGNASAQGNLGYMYGSGRGVLQNPILSFAWHSVATVNGDDFFRKSRDRVAKDLSPQELKEGRKLAAQILEIIENNQSVSDSIGQQEPTRPRIVGTGSGFIVTDNGYIVTCFHVIDGASSIKVKVHNLEYSARLERVDRSNDLALLKIQGSFSALAFASRRSVKMGSEVFTIGYPNPILQGVNSKLTKGNINSLTGFQDDVRLFQISVPVQPGNSGGALCDLKGDVVGIIVSILKSEVAFKITGSLPQNVNYAIKSSYAESLIDTVPEVVNRLKKSHKQFSFEKTVEQVKKSTVMIISYK